MTGTMNEVLLKWFQENEAAVSELALSVWENAEPIFEEHHACEVTAKFMQKQGFQVETFHILGGNRQPDAVVATWGSGKPVIGFYGEYDGLPDHGQEAVPYRAPIEGKCGHGCGHNLINISGASAAAALKATMEAEGLSGTVKYMACPAEEGGNGKMHMARRGVFDDLDCCFGWHPQPGSNLKIKEVIMNTGVNMKVEFFGRRAHVSAAPQNGRSALDAIELTNVAINYMREHIPANCRIFYSYLAGATDPLPDYAAYTYCIRANDVTNANSLYHRLEKCIEGASKMTETTYKITVESVSYAPLQIDDFNALLGDALTKLPPLTYTESELAFARELFRNVTGREGKNDEEVIPSQVETPSFIHNHVPNTTDVGWLARKVPTARLMGLSMIGGTAMHSWACVACTGHSIGVKGGIWAGMAMAQGGYDVLHNTDRISGWWDDLRGQTADETDFDF